MRLLLAALIAALVSASPAFADFYALRDAARAGNLQSVREMLAAGEDPNPPSWEDGYSPLQFAAGHHGDVEMVRLLLAAGADPDYRDHNGDRALIWAARWGHAGAVDVLLQAGSPPDSEDDPYHDSPLMAAARYARVEVMRLLLDAGADPNWRGQSEDTALHEAALTDNVEAMRLLFETGADPNLRDDIFNETPLHVAAVWSTPAAVAAMIAAGAELETRARDDETPLFLAAKSGNGPVVAALLDAGVDPDAADANGRTPMRAALAANNGRGLNGVSVARLAEVTSDLDRSLVAAIEQGYHAAAMRLLERGADPNARGEDGQSALAATTSVPGLTWFRLLVNRGADVDSLAAETMFAAAARGHMLIADELMARGIGADIRDARGATPLLYAVQNGHVEMVARLLGAGAAADAVDHAGHGAEDYMAIVPAFYEGRIAARQASRAYKPTGMLEMLLIDIHARHDAIRSLLAEAA